MRLALGPRARRWWARARARRRIDRQLLAILECELSWPGCRVFGATVVELEGEPAVACQSCADRSAIPTCQEATT